MSCNIHTYDGSLLGVFSLDCLKSSHNQHAWGGFSNWPEDCQTSWASNSIIFWSSYYTLFLFQIISLYKLVIILMFCIPIPLYCRNHVVVPWFILCSWRVDALINHPYKDIKDLKLELMMMACLSFRISNLAVDKSSFIFLFR